MKKEVRKPEHGDDFEVVEAYNKAKKGEYKKMLKRFKKELKKASKKYGPFDECYLFEFMKIIFKSWIDFYTLRVNIFGMERQDEAREALESDKDSNGEELDEKTRKYYEEMIHVPTRLEIATTLLNLLEDEETSFWNFDDNTSDEKMKKFTDYFAEYIHYMWD
ncbi:MAG: hypothetical protein J5656_05735 [Clostridia bacterium]|nr:hypothetical protein [Clostridia bacterium]